MESEDRDIFDRMKAALDASPKSHGSSHKLDDISEHILQTLEAAVILYTSGFVPTSTFLAVTAIEELAKFRFLMFGTGSNSAGGRSIPAYSHRKKQALGAGIFPVALRPRLVEACGEDEAHELLQLARMGGLARVREQCLYFESTETTVKFPAECVTPNLSRRILLLAIDEFDDEVTGWTDKSYRYGERATELFKLVDSAI